MKLIAKLEELAFATRLRLLSERISNDVEKIYSDIDLDFDPRWFVMIYALIEKSPRAITELSEIIGISHTAVNNLAKEIQKVGLITKSVDNNDGRIRNLNITKKGIDYFSVLEPVLSSIQTVTKDIIDSADPHFLNKISIIEKSLDQRSLYERIYYELNGHYPRDLNILKYKPKLRKHFIRLNKEWLNELFTIEEYDLKLLNDPNRKIIKKGGMVFFAEKNSDIIGTCAIIPITDGIFEIAKLAVRKSARNNGIGRKLISEAIKYAKNAKCDILLVRTNKKLKTSNHLYTSFGFFKTREDYPFKWQYQRKTFTLQLNLN